MDALASLVISNVHCHWCHLPDVHVRGISSFSLLLDDLEPFLRSAETQARAYALFGRPEYFFVIGVGPKERKEKRRKEEKKDRLTVAVRHGHLIPSNRLLMLFKNHFYSNCLFPKIMCCCRSGSFVEPGLLRN